MQRGEVLEIFAIASRDSAKAREAAARFTLQGDAF
jgi:hypothetical protein